MKGKTLFLIIITWVIFSSISILLYLPNFFQKISAQKSDRVISIQIDFQDVEYFSQKEKRPIENLLKSIRAIPAFIISLDSDASKSNEKLIRKYEFKILWRKNQENDLNPRDVLSRMEKGDGVLAYEDVALGYPDHLNEVVAEIIRKNGFIPIFEFSAQKGLVYLARNLPGKYIKGHCIQAREVIEPKLTLWRNRLIRAVDQRWVRLLEIRLCPKLTWDENVGFQKSVVKNLQAKKYLFGAPGSSSIFQSQIQLDLYPPGTGLKIRIFLILFLSLFTPIMEILFFKQKGFVSPVGVLICVSVLSLITGIAIHALGSHPFLVFGFERVPGIRVQLILPLLAGFVLLIKKVEIIRFFKGPLNYWRLSLLLGLGVAFLGVYLMRSGNWPLISVFSWERHLRDWLDAWLGSRPRFKEFLIGHPALILGVWLKSQNIKGGNLIKDGRLLMGLGLIGQISIINTFMHFHASVVLELLRVQNGLILGYLFGLIAIFIWDLKRWEKT